MLCLWRKKWFWPSFKISNLWKIIKNVLFTNVMRIPLYCLNFLAIWFVSGPLKARLRNNLSWFCQIWFLSMDTYPELKIYLKHFWAFIPTNHYWYIFVIEDTTQELFCQLNLLWSLLYIWRMDSWAENKLLFLDDEHKHMLIYLKETVIAELNKWCK